MERRLNMKNIKLLTLLIIGLIACTGCEAKPLAEVTSEDYTYDSTKAFNIDDILSNVSEDTKVDYVIDEDNSKVVITLTKGDKTETLEKDITISKPTIEVSDGITYDSYTQELDLEDHITKPETTTYDYTLDVDNNSITINFTDGEYKETITKDLVVVDSTPTVNKNVWICTDVDGGWVIYFTIKDDSTFTSTELVNNSGRIEGNVLYANNSTDKLYYTETSNGVNLYSAHPDYYGTPIYSCVYSSN